MDSITHIVVGATTGYLIAGKKYGKKAMIWGALAGSLPDIDVVSAMWLNPADRLLAHRGFTHSILFMLLISPVLAWLGVNYFKKDFQNKPGMRYFIASFLLVIATVTGFLINILLYSFDGLWLLLSLPFSVWAGIKFLKLFKEYVFRPDEHIQVDFKTLWLVFFISLCTHLFLDSCTTYGTGLFEPFSTYRVAINNISVADIFFTIPAAIILVLTCLLPKSFMYAKINVAWMGLYFIMTFFNYASMNTVFTKSLDSQHFQVKKKMISPSILNNFLWYTIAETDTAFVSGQYSVFDKADEVGKFLVMPKSYQLMPVGDESKDVATLRRFSKGYFNLCTNGQGDLQWNDLRFGIMGDTIQNAGDYVFKLKLKPDATGLKAHASREMNKSIVEIWPVYWQRVFGIK